MSPANSKGKRKATERTPLLDECGNPAGDAPSEDQEIQDSQPNSVSRQSILRQAWRSHLLTTALILLTVCFGLFLGIILLAESYAAPARHNIDRGLSQPGGDMFWKEAVPMRGPDAVNVVGLERVEDGTGVSQLQINMSVTMRMTIDTDFIMGFRDGNFMADGWWTRRWKAIGRWSVRRLGSTTATVDNIAVYPSSPAASTTSLLNIKPLSPISISLSPGLSSHSSLQSVSIPFLITPCQNASVLQHFAEQSWTRAFVSVRMHGSGLQVHGGQDPKLARWWEIGQWRNLLRLKKPEVAFSLNLPIPPLDIPSHPPTKPGSGLPSLSDFLTLESFSITTAPSPDTPEPVPTSTPQVSQPIASDPARGSANISTFLIQQAWRQQSSMSSTLLNLLQSRYSSGLGNIIITARASVAHPFSSFASKLDLPVQPFPIKIALPVRKDDSSTSALSHTLQDTHIPADIIPVAEVFASPSFNTTHIRIPLSGFVLPLSSSSSELADAVSRFASSYLSYKSAAIAIFSPLYPSLLVRTAFPPPAERIEILRNVTIENMSIRPTLGPIIVPDSYQELVSQAVDPVPSVLDILASATVHARAVLPPGVNIDIDVARLWIDCLVFDGEVPKDITSQTAGDGHTTPAEEKEPPVSGTGNPPVPIPSPLPDPLPERAFARITPRTWLNASSTHSSPGDPDDFEIRGGIQVTKKDTGTNVFVTARIIDVPLEVLPGRGDELSKFVTKVLFSKEPVVAGIRGVAAVGVGVPGLTGPTSSELILSGLPFEGNVKVGGRKSLRL